MPYVNVNITGSGGGGGGSGSVVSVNGKTGAVVITSSDIGIADVMQLKGVVATKSALPTTAATGDVYQSSDDNTLYCYIDGTWASIGTSQVDLSQYVTTDMLTGATGSTLTDAKAYADSAVLTVPTVRPSFTQDYTGSNVFTLPRVPDVIFDILVLDTDTNLYYLRTTDYTVSGADVTINAPTLVTGMTVKINYTAV